MDQILSRLYCGSLEDAQAWTYKDGQAIVTLSEQRIDKNASPLLIHVAYLPIPDEAWLPREIWKSRVDALAHYLGLHWTVLVHCRLGVSRSPALCAAYLAHTGWDLDEALAYVQSKRACTKVHGETWRGVKEWLCGNML